MMKQLLATVLLTLLACPSEGEVPAKAKPLFNGVSYLHERRTDPRPLSLHLVSIEQETKGIHYAVTPPNPQRTGKENQVLLKRTSTIAQEMGAQVAINGTFYIKKEKAEQQGSPAGICFLAVHDGRAYSQRAAEDEVVVRALKGRCDLWVKPGKSTWEFKPGDGQMALGMARWAQLIRNGAIVAPSGNDLHPRTAIGTSRDGNLCFLMVVDGRQKGFSEGVSLKELAELLQEFGADNGINLDGGGSTTLVVQQPDGRYRIMNRPSDFYPLSVERPVGTHFLVFADGLPQ